MDDSLHQPPAPTNQSGSTEAPKVIEAPAAAIIDSKTRNKLEIINSFKLVATIVAALATLWLIATYVICPVTVNGISMQPTFYTGNVVLVWKFPETLAAITNSQYIPARGNIVILKQTPVSGEELIKRVVGLPGETIDINNGQVTIYNASHPNGFDPDLVYFHQARPTAGLVNTQIPPGRIFVMGDNRIAGASIDSRSSIGTVPSNGIQGRVVMKIYPFNELKLF